MMGSGGILSSYSLEERSRAHRRRVPAGAIGPRCKTAQQSDIVSNLSTPDNAETDSSPQGNDRLILEKTKLELETRKLELEIKQLSAGWTRTPSNWWSIATILIALLGFGWAAMTGVFDVSKRELEVRKREVQMEIQDLTQRHDRQSREYAVEAAKQQKEIQRLQSEVVSAQLHVNSLTTELAAKTTRLLQLDQPIVTSWEATGDVDDASISFTGLNFGTARGQISCMLAGYTETVTGDPDTDKKMPGKYETAEFCTVVAWSANGARAHFNVPYFRKTMFSPLDSFDFTLTRSDGKSITKKVTLPEDWRKASSK